MTFKDALKTREFVVTAQLNLSDAPNSETLLVQGNVLRSVVDAVQLNDSKHPHMSGIAAAAILIQHGLDPIVHMNSRDRNRIAMQKDLIGAAALGVTSVLVTRGAKIPNSNKIGVRNVYDTPALEFMAYIQGLKQDEATPVVADFMIGANAELFEPDDAWTPKNLIRKCDAGTNFVQLQLCFDPEVARSYMARIVETKLTHRASFIAALSPLPSAEVARWVQENVKGALVPSEVIERLEGATDPKSEGIRICTELLRELTTIPGISGVNMLSLGELDAIPAVIQAAGVRPG